MGIPTRTDGIGIFQIRQGKVDTTTPNPLPHPDPFSGELKEWMLGVDVGESRRYELASGGVTVPEEIYQKTLTCRDIIGKCSRGKGHQAKK